MHKSASLPLDRRDKILRRREVEDLTGLTRSVLYRLIKSGDFPRQRQLSVSTVGWLESDVLAWILERKVL